MYVHTIRMITIIISVNVILLLRAHLQIQRFLGCSCRHEMMKALFLTASLGEKPYLEVVRKRHFIVSHMQYKYAAIVVTHIGCIFFNTLIKN